MIEKFVWKSVIFIIATMKTFYKNKEDME